MQEVILSKQIDISISKKGKKPVILLKRVARIPPGKGRNSASFRMIDETCLDPWKISKRSLTIKANVIHRITEC